MSTIRSMTPASPRVVLLADGIARFRKRLTTACCVVTFVDGDSMETREERIDDGSRNSVSAISPVGLAMVDIPFQT